MTHEELRRALLTERFTPHTRGTDEPDDEAAVARRCRELLDDVTKQEERDPQ